ncbi:hypothetical protein AAHE18_03G140500 [Arachis hypogaea]
MRSPITKLYSPFDIFLITTSSSSSISSFSSVSSWFVSPSITSSSPLPVFLSLFTMSAKKRVLFSCVIWFFSAATGTFSTWASLCTTLFSAPSSIQFAEHGNRARMPEKTSFALVFLPFFKDLFSTSSLGPGGQEAPPLTKPPRIPLTGRMR